MNSKIDVIIPVYNGEKYIGSALDSVLCQSYPPEKIIIVNDGSTDGTEKIIRKYAKKDNRIILINQKNRGLSSARNTGIKESRGEYIAFLDADDTWEENKLNKQIELFKKSGYKDLGVVFCGYRLIDEKDREITKHPKVALDNKLRGNIYKILLMGNSVSGSGSSVLIKRDCFEKAGLFDEKLPSCEDWDMWIRIAKIYSFDFSPEKMVNIRMVKGGISSDENRMNKGFLLVMDKIFLNNPVDYCLLKTFRKNIITWCIKNKNIKSIQELKPFASDKLWKKIWDDKISFISDIFIALLTTSYIKFIKPLIYPKFLNNE